MSELHSPESHVLADRADVDVSVFFERIKSYVGWQERDAERVRLAWPQVKPLVPGLVEDFYRTILAHDFTSRVISGGEPQVERLKGTLASWVESLFTGSYDDEFAETRWRVGRRHVQIGLNQAYAMAALTRLRIGITSGLCQVSDLPGHELCETVIAVNKLLDMDAAIIDYAYQQSFAQLLEESAAAKVQQSERLAAIGQMVTGLAHESRNVLQRSHACLEALLQDIEDRPEALKQAHRIQNALDRLHILYEEVRNYAAPINLDREAVDLVRLTSTAWYNLETRWRDLSTTLAVNCSQPADAIILADRHRLDQVLTNLLQNAIDAAGPSGAICCTIARTPDNAYCQLTLEDNGPGISGDRLSRIFEPFFTTKTKGTGLGLAITRRIIEAHHGKIEVDRSELGGARMTISLPANDQPKASASGHA
jgi:signal transduction histidine kinase